MAVHVGENWKILPEKDAPDVIIVNLDISGSSLIDKGLKNEWDLLDEVNALQDQVQRCFSGRNWLVGEWSGDGLVALCLDPKAEADDAVNDVIKVLQVMEDWRKETKANYSRSAQFIDGVNVRIGIFSGRIRWRAANVPMTGRIISPCMNKAGHMQKECEEGTVVINEVTFKNLSKLKESFPEALKRRIRHGETDIEVYTYRPPIPPSALSVEGNIEDRILQALNDCQFIARAPGACYFFGEFAVMFGHMALIQPIPRYVYVGIRREGAKKATKVILEEGFAVRPDIDLCNQSILQTIKIPDDFTSVSWTSDELDQINKITKAVLGKNAGDLRVKIYSLIPKKCGLNSSSAVSIGLAGVFFPKDLTKLRHRLDNLDGSVAFYLESNDELSRLFKTAWAFDNVFHGGSSSGSGLTASGMGALDGWPLVYVAESRSFQGPYPIAFDHLPEDESDKSWEPLRRIRFLVHRTKPLRGKANKLDIQHEYAIFHVCERVSDATTKDIITQFLGAQHFSGDAAKRIKERLNYDKKQFHKYYLPTDLIAKALELADLDKKESFTSRTGKQISRLSEMLVESFAQALGACAMSGISAFIQKDFQTLQWTDFAQCMNAYQQLMCACGVSEPLTDSVNYRTDAFAYDYGTLAGPLPFGTKLTGAGRGGDFVVVAASPGLSRSFQTFRHEVRITSKLLPCHFASWLETTACQGTVLLKG